MDCGFNLGDVVKWRSSSWIIRLWPALSLGQLDERIPYSTEFNISPPLSWFTIKGALTESQVAYGDLRR